MNKVEVKHFHLFCGLGGGAKGFNNGQARVGSLEAKFRCIGGIDNTPAAIRDFNKLSGVDGTVLDLFTREQYIAFNGKKPPADWREATPEDLRNAAGNESPNIVFTSPPCKGFSGLLNNTLSASAKYQALNALTLRGIWLSLEAWADDPPEFFLLENVPRIRTRGAQLLEQIESLLHTYGFATAATEHDCGELGGLAQRRKRFLLVGRHEEKIPPFLYEPVRKPLKSVGDVLDKFPTPGDPIAGAMHKLPSLQWKTWVRLSLIEAGGDWRSLNKLDVVDGKLKNYAIMPETTWHRGVLGVTAWNEVACTVTGRGMPSCGKFSVADPKILGDQDYPRYGVLGWNDTAGTLTGQSAPGGGRFSIADPSLERAYYKNVYRVIPWHGIAGTVTTGTSPSNGGQVIADPTINWPQNNLVATYNDEEITIPEDNENCIAVIRSIDGTWHRPFTTLELAALQGLVDAEDFIELDGKSDKAWRERIGNAVPPKAAQAIASMMGETLLLARAGETFALGSTPIWVRKLAIGLSVDTKNYQIAAKNP